MTADRRDLPPPLPPRPRGVREMLVDGTDVTSEQLRSLVIRACNGVLELSGQMGHALRELSEHSHRLTAIEMWRRGESSSHDWTEDLRKADEILKQRVDNARDPMDSDRARAIAREVVEHARTADKAAKYDRGSDMRRQILLIVISAVVGAAISLGISRISSGAPQHSAVPAGAVH